jgi:hypothetical protein
MSTTIAVDAQLWARVSSTVAISCNPPPDPPNSWGTINPKTPDLPSSAIACRGNLRERSVSSALEARTPWAMRLLSVKMWGGVGIESGRRGRHMGSFYYKSIGSTSCVICAKESQTADLSGLSYRTAGDRHSSKRRISTRGNRKGQHGFGS